MTPKRIILLAAVLSGLAVYLVLFYATGLPSPAPATGHVVRRVEFFLWLLVPEDLLEGWFGSPPELSLLDRLPVLAIAGVILAYAASLGWLLMALVRADRGLTRLERFVFSTAVGLNVVSTYVLLVGLLGLLDNLLVFAVPAALTLAATGRLLWRRSIERVDDERRRSGKPRPAASRGEDATADADDWLSPRWLWLAAPFALVIVLGGMLPPIDFDVREYHLQVPKEFFQQGRIGFLPHNVYGNMPMGTEMLSLLGMVIAGDWWLGALAGKTVIAAFTPLTALGLLAAGRRFFSLGAGVVAAVVYLSIPWIIRVSTNGLVEGASAFYLLLAVYALLLHNKTRAEKRSSLVLLAGYLAGGAVACKIPALLFVLLPLAAWVAFGRRETDKTPGHGTPPDRPQKPSSLKQPAKECGRLLLEGLPSARPAWKPLAVFLLAALIGCGLWFGKNWVLAGNPTYPLLYGVFGGETWTAEKDQQWNRVHRPHDFSPGTLAKDLGRVGLTSEWLSPLVLPLAALAFLVRRHRRLSIVLAVYFGYVILVWWLFTHRIDRFWIPTLPLVALLAGVGACWSRDRVWRGVLIGLLLFGSLSNLLVATSGPGGYNRYFVGLQRLRESSERVDAWHQYFNTYCPDGRVLMVGEAQVFDLQMPVLYNTCFDDSIFERLVKGRTPEEARSAMLAGGITHVYVDWGEIARYRSPGNYGFTQFVQPAVFQRLVEQGVLDPLPILEGSPGRAYRVVGEAGG